MQKNHRYLNNTINNSPTVSTRSIHCLILLCTQSLSEVFNRLVVASRITSHTGWSHKTVRDFAVDKDNNRWLSFLDPGGGSQTATLVVVVVVVISSLKIPKAFLIRSAAQRNFAHAFVLIIHSFIFFCHTL